MPELKSARQEQIAQLLAQNKSNGEICQITGLRAPNVAQFTKRKNVTDRVDEIKGLKPKTTQELELEAELSTGGVSTEFQIRQLTSDIAEARKAQHWSAVSSLSSLLARVTGAIQKEPQKSNEKDRQRAFVKDGEDNASSTGVMLTDDHLTMLLGQLTGVTTPEEHRRDAYESFRRVLIHANVHNWATYTGHECQQALKDTIGMEYADVLKAITDELEAIHSRHRERGAVIQVVDQPKQTSKIPEWVKVKQPQPRVIVRVAKGTA